MYAQIVCSACGNWTDTGNFCIRCGSRLGGPPMPPQNLPVSPYNPMSPGFQQAYAYQGMATYQQYNPYASYSLQSYNPYAGYAPQQTSQMMPYYVSAYYAQPQIMGQRRMLPQRPYFY